MAGFEPADTRFAVWRLWPLGYMCMMDMTGFEPMNRGCWTLPAVRVPCLPWLHIHNEDDRIRTGDDGVKVRCLKPLGYVPVKRRM